MPDRQEPLTYSFTYKDAVDILRLIRENETVTRFELELGDIKLSVDRASAAATAAPQVPAAASIRPSGAASTAFAVRDEPVTDAPVRTDGMQRIAAPMLGIFFRSPSPGAPPFVNEGDLVRPGDTVGLIEVMKLFTPVVAECAGRVLRIEATDATLVEHGQTLFLIEPAGDA